MKKGILFLMAWIPFAAAAQTDNTTAFSITGNFKKMKDTVEWVYLYYMNSNNRMSDSCKVEKGVYHFKGNVDEPTISRLRAVYKNKNAIAGNTKDFATLFLQPGKITINSTDSFSNVTVKGAAGQAVYAEFEKLTKAFSDSMQLYYQLYAEARKSNDMATMKAIEIKAESMNKEVKESVFAPFIKNNPTSAVALMALQQYAGYDIDVDKVEPLFTMLSPEIKKYPSALLLKERLDFTKRIAIGQLAADFTQNDTLGNPVALSSLRGKYLLVDFWASWCGPCRAENPNVVYAYNKYKEKGKGFSVLGISLDRPGAKDAWLKAIHDDNLTWTHVSDLQFWNNAAAKLYGIQSIPQNFLLDPAGKIIGKNLRGPDLDKKLEEVLGN